MKKELLVKDRVFWINFIQAISIYAVVVFSTGIVISEGSINFKLSTGLMFSSIFAVFHSSYCVAMGFFESEKINEFIKEKGITNHEFQDRYGELMDKIKRW